MHHQKRLAVMNIKTSPPVITPRGIWRRYWKQDVRIFSTFQHKAQSQILPSLYLHMLVPASQAHCAVLPKTCFCFTFELAVPEVIDLCPTRASGPAGKHICLFCWLLCESIWEISGSAGKLNIKIVLITLFMIWNVKGVARIDEPTENCHLRLQLHSVVGSLICLTKTFTVLVPTAFLWPLQAAVF